MKQELFDIAPLPPFAWAPELWMWLLPLAVFIVAGFFFALSRILRNPKPKPLTPADLEELIADLADAPQTELPDRAAALLRSALSLSSRQILLGNTAKEIQERLSANSKYTLALSLLLEFKYA